MLCTSAANIDRHLRGMLCTGAANVQLARGAICCPGRLFRLFGWVGDYDAFLFLADNHTFVFLATDSAGNNDSLHPISSRSTAQP
jgi:hypothetical protein